VKFWAIEIAATLVFLKWLVAALLNDLGTSPDTIGTVIHNYAQIETVNPAGRMSHKGP